MRSVSGGLQYVTDDVTGQADDENTTTMLGGSTHIKYPGWRKHGGQATREIRKGQGLATGREKKTCKRGGRGPMHADFRGRSLL